MYEKSEEIILLKNIVMGNGDGKVIHIPMFSMRSYETNKYDLTCDGNMNRLVSVWLNVIKSYKDERPGIRLKLDIRIVVPSLDDMTSQSVDYLKKVEDEADGYLTFVYGFKYPAGGPKVIRSLKGSLELNQCLDNFFQSFSGKRVVVYEAEYVGAFLESRKKKYNEYAYNSMTTIFWCPVSDTMKVQPYFLENVRYVDRELAGVCDYLMVATLNQVEYFQKCRDRKPIILLDMLIDPSLSIFSFKEDKEMKDIISKYEAKGKQIIYFPFRLSDSGYRFREIVDCLEQIDALYPVVVLYTDPNDTAKDMIPGDVNLEFVKVPSNRDAYYTCISDKRCIIPYFEDVDNIMHASWQEMQYYKSSIVTFGYMARCASHVYHALMEFIEKKNTVNNI